MFRPLICLESQLDQNTESALIPHSLTVIYQTHLPKVDSGLIHDLLIHELNKKSDDTSTLPPFYMVEIRMAEGTDQEQMKNMIFEKTGFYLPLLKMVHTM